MSLYGSSLVAHQISGRYACRCSPQIFSGRAVQDML